MNYVLWGKLNIAIMTNSFYKLFFKNLFGIKGRANRQEYIVRFLLMPFLGYITNTVADAYQSTGNLLIGLLMMVLCPVFILSIIQVFFVTHRRLHDLNTSGWWQLITFVPCGQLLMIGLIFYKGTPGSNKYGEPPID